MYNPEDSARVAAPRTEISESLSKASAARTSSDLTFGRLPPLRPRASAAFRPALVRSRMMERSNWARAPKMWKNSSPAAEVVSITSVRERKPWKAFAHGRQDLGADQRPHQQSVGEGAVLIRQLGYQ